MPVGYLIWTVILISTEYCKFVMAHESYECFCGGPLISMAVFRSHKHSMQLFIFNQISTFRLAHLFAKCSERQHFLNTHSN